MLDLSGLLGLTASSALPLLAASWLPRTTLNGCLSPHLEIGNEGNAMKAIIGILLLILVLLQWRLWVGDGGVQELTQLEQELAAQQAENEALQQRNQMLENEILDLKNGVEAVEERARSDLGMIREGETFYMVID